MKILELFSGTESIASAFRAKGNEVITVDIDSRFNPTFVSDIMDFKYLWLRPDIIWASPPCTTFSVASIGHHWRGGRNAYIPKTKEAELGITLVKATIKIIEDLKPRYWFIENPRGVLRKMDFMRNLPRYTVSYCQYGDKRMKPTDIWTNTPLVPRMCHNGNKDHEPAPRGARTGTQGLKNAVERGRIPKRFCEEVVEICSRK